MGGPTLSGGERLSGPIPTLRMVKPVLALVILNLSVALSLASVRHGVSRPPVPTMKFSGPVWLNQRPSVLGLAGGIASGKSTVSKVLANCGGMKVIDADRLGHESYMPGTRCFNNLVYEFGEQIVGEDGTIDRRALGEAVCTDILLSRVPIKHVLQYDVLISIARVDQQPDLLRVEHISTHHHPC